MDNSHALESLLIRYPQLLSVRNEIEAATELLVRAFGNNGKVLVCGNGGSSADAGHIVGELLKSFELKRPLSQIFKANLLQVSPERGEFLSEQLQQGLPAISLTAHSALITAVANDINADLIFAQQITGYGKTGDVLIGISCSGNSQNIIDALITAKAMGLSTIGLSGKTGGKMREFCDVSIQVPETRTSLIQELHLPIYHTICLLVESHFFSFPES
jgi:D-sedoheptulose 7-phosphate isomerase